MRRGGRAFGAGGGVARGRTRRSSGLGGGGASAANAEGVKTRARARDARIELNYETRAYIIDRPVVVVGETRAIATFRACAPVERVSIF